MKPGFAEQGCAGTCVRGVLAAVGVGLQQQPKATKLTVHAVVISLAIAHALGQLVAGNPSRWACWLTSSSAKGNWLIAGWPLVCSSRFSSSHSWALLGSKPRAPMLLSVRMSSQGFWL